jgi:hypothetical protein
LTFHCGITFARADAVSRNQHSNAAANTGGATVTRTADGDVLIGSGSGMGGGTGVRRIVVAHGPGGWTAEERWTSNGLKPYYNDFVVHKGHAFGFDGSILACIDLADGTREVITGKGVGQGPDLRQPERLALDLLHGRVLVLDPFAQRVVRVEKGVTDQAGPDNRRRAFRNIAARWPIPRCPGERGRRSPPR